MPIPRISKPGPLARNTLALTGGMGARVLMLAILFLLVSRTLGVEQYGQFTATLALISFFCPFAGLGASTLLLRDTACSPLEARRFWGRALLVTLMTAIPLAFGAIILGKLLLPDTTSLKLVFYLVIAELVLMPLTQLGNALYQGLEKSAVTALFIAGVALFRLGAFLLLILFLAAPTAEAWGLYYLASTLAFTLLVITFMWRDLGTPIWNIPDIRIVLKDGLSYSIMQSSDRLSNDVDKVMLSRMDGLATTGLYAAGYRIVEMLFLPVSALLWNTLSRFFRTGGVGARAALRYGLQLLPLPLLFITLCLAAVYLGGHYLPALLGEGFIDIENVVFLLALLMAVLFIRNLLRQIIVGTRSSVPAAIIGLSGSLINIAANLLLIPSYSWKGAVMATFFSEFSMIVLLSIVLTVMVTSETPDAATDL